MKKQSLVLALAALACSSAFAQASAGSGGAAVTQEVNPSTSGNAPAAKAEMKVDNRKASGSILAVPNPGAVTTPTQQVNPYASSGAPEAKAQRKVDARTNAAATGSMDTNGDGMVSKREWDRYHSGMWGQMKSKNGMMSMSDMEAQRKNIPY